VRSAATRGCGGAHCSPVLRAGPRARQRRVRKVAASASAASSLLGEIASRLDAARPLPAPADAGYGLTPRERDVLALVAEGLSNRQIVTELYISPNTAGVHVSHILTKFGAATRTEAAAIAHRRRLTEG
jgi:DNA-binding NarL/FixJ family response regulator